MSRYNNKSSLFRFKGKLHKFILAILSVILFFSIAEATLRFIKFRVNQTGGYLKFACWNFVADNYDIPKQVYDPYLFWRVNRKEYFRGRHLSLIKPKDNYRIICLGDSTTQGHLIPSFKGTYPYMLEEILNRNSNQIKFEVINAGCGGYSSFQGLRYLKSELLEYDPDLLIVWLGIHDASTAILYSDKEQRLQNERIVKTEKVLNRSKFYQFYRQGLFYIMFLFKQKNKDKNRVSAEDYCQNLKEIAGLAKERDIIAVFIIPLVKSRSRLLSFEKSGDSDYVKVFDEFLKEGIPVIDLISVFKQKKGFAQYFTDRCHLTLEGNRVIAEAIYDVLITKVIIQNNS